MLRIIVAMGLAIIAGGAGDIFLAEGMKSLGQVSVHRLGDIAPLVRRVFSNRCVLLGLLAHALYFASFMSALAWVDVSVVIPLTALSYVIATGYAALFAHERVDTLRWAGVIAITTGAVLVGISS